MNKKTIGEKICNMSELIRWVIVGSSIFIAYNSWGNINLQINILAIGIILPIFGLSSIEGLFFSKSASNLSGYTPSEYQKQSALAFLSISLIAIVVYLLDWNIYTKMTLLLLALILIFLSGANHTLSTILNKNYSKRNLLRPFLSLLLILSIAPILFIFFKN